MKLLNGLAERCGGRTMQQVLRRIWSELNERLRLRRGRGDTSEDDEGLPHSPCNSPTTSDGLLLDKTAIKDLPVKSHSTCSDGSLLSMGSSEMDEDSLGPQSRHSSKLSLHDKKSATSTTAVATTGAFSDFEFTPPLNHSAAHHRVAVKPKRTHGAPKRKKLPSAPLPATPEVNEDSSTRSVSPENNTRKETLTELYSMTAAKTALTTETQLKCSSLPPGLTAPGNNSAVDMSNKLNRSKSNAGSKSHDYFVAVHEDDKEEKLSLFDRIFPRKSGRKKKKEVVQVVETSSVVKHTTTVSKPIPAPRSGPAARQRVQPCDIPATPDEVRKSDSSKLSTSLSTSPKSPVALPRSPKNIAYADNTAVIKSSKVKIAGLSSLQQRVLSLNDTTDNVAFKSLTDFPSEPTTSPPTKPVTKSFSFKSSKKPADDSIKSTEEFLKREREQQSRTSFFTKAASLDSVKNLDDTKMKEPQSSASVAKSEDSLLKLEHDSINELFRDSSIVISGPSHTAVVNVSSSKDFKDFKSESSETWEDGGGVHKMVKEHQISVTKIQVKRESTEVSTISVPKGSVPEFLNKQLNKVETRPTSNIIFSMKSPKVQEQEQLPAAERPKTLFDFNEVTVAKPPAPRKFSKENLEIIEKPATTPTTEEHSPKTPPVALSSSPLNRFKKHDTKVTSGGGGGATNTGSRKSSVVSITPESPVKETRNIFKSRSASLDSLKSDGAFSDKSSQDSLDKLDSPVTGGVAGGAVVLRKRSSLSKKSPGDDEPELMKVFARRSLKLKDGEIDAIQDSLDAKTTSKDSDKENQDSPVDGRKKWINEAINDGDLPPRRKSLNFIETKQTKEPLVENKTTSPVADVKNNKNAVLASPPTLRRTSNLFATQRAISLQPPKTTSEFILKKQPSFQEQRKIDKWIKSSEETLIDDHLNSEFITEPKNFSQRKAEWEKRAQQAQRKTTP